MANLKIIKTFGTPFDDKCRNKIGFNTGTGWFNIIHEDGSISEQSDLTGRGYKLATLEEIKDNWHLIHPHWTPEKGDRVVVIQNLTDWENESAVVIENDVEYGEGWYRVERNGNRTSIFTKQQMVLAPYDSVQVSEPEVDGAPTTEIVESTERFWGDYKIGDKIKIIENTSYSNLKLGGVYSIDRLERESSSRSGMPLSVKSDTGVSMWLYPSQFERYEESKTTTTTVTETDTPEVKSESPIGWRWQDLKIGDKVKIIGGTSPHRPVGSIFTISKIEPEYYRGGLPILVVTDQGKNMGWPDIEHFEPYYDDVIEPVQSSLDGFTIGDRVTCTATVATVGTLFGMHGTVVNLSDGLIGVSFDEYIHGHDCNGHCDNKTGWYMQSRQIEHYIKPKVPIKPDVYEGPMKPEEETVSIRFLTEQEFKDKGLWRDDGYPASWNDGGLMNKYLGQSIIIPKSIINSDGIFRYEDWTFLKKHYVLSESIVQSDGTFTLEPSKPLTPTTNAETNKAMEKFNIGDSVKGNSWPFKDKIGIIRALEPDRRFGVAFTEKGVGGGHDLSGKCKDGYGWYCTEDEITLVTDALIPPVRFKVGDQITYKNRGDCKSGDYYYSGECQGAYVGTVKEIYHFVEEHNCYKISVTAKRGSSYHMLESEFVEYAQLAQSPGYTTVNIDPTVFGVNIHKTHPTPSTDLSAYTQSPITFKAKPKPKLKVI